MSSIDEESPLVEETIIPEPTYAPKKTLAELRAMHNGLDTMFMTVTILSVAPKSIMYKMRNDRNTKSCHFTPPHCQPDDVLEFLEVGKHYGVLSFNPTGEAKGFFWRYIVSIT